MALRLLATIWSRGRRCANCGSYSRQNSHGRPERVSKRLMMAGSMCSMRSGSWEGVKQFHPVYESESQSPPRLTYRFMTDSFVLQGRELRKPCKRPRVAACYQLRATAELRPLAARRAVISGIIRPLFFMKIASPEIL